MNIADILIEHARDRAGHPAIEDGDRIVTFGELDDLVDTAAANLQAAGVEPGNIVAVLLDDSADHLIILCALARVGAVIFSLNASASRPELQQHGHDITRLNPCRKQSVDGCVYSAARQRSLPAGRNIVRRNRSWRR